MSYGSDTLLMKLPSSNTSASVSSMKPNPAPVPGQGKVDGILYLDIDDEDLQRLERFGGDEYDRIALEVTLPDGTIVQAQTYVYKNTYAHRLEQSTWCVDTFRREGIHTFVSQNVGFSGIQPSFRQSNTTKKYLEYFLQNSKHKESLWQ